MGFSDAPIEQARLVEYWRSPVGIAHGKYIKGAIQEESIVQTGAVGGRAADFHQEMIRVLSRADPYWVAEPICSFLNTSADSFPSATLPEGTVPSRFGFVYFATPLSLPPDRIDGHMRPRMLRAFSWETVEVSPDSMWRYWVPWDGYPGSGSAIVASSYEDSGVGRWLDLRFTIRWDFGTPWVPEELLTRSLGIESVAAATATRRHLGQFLYLLRQRQVTVSTHAVTNGGARKKIARVFPVPPEVRTIDLQRLDLGHWRNQYYPSTGEYRPLLVAPRANDRA